MLTLPAWTNNIVIQFVILIASFVLLFKSADYFVESAVGIAYHLKLPKLIVGIVIVGFATTAPEISVSAISSFAGKPEIAFGNALGSVLCNTGAALGLAAIFSIKNIEIDKSLLKTIGAFLLAIIVISFVFSANGNINFYEGLILLIIMFSYFGFLLFNEKQKRKKRKIEGIEEKDEFEKPKDSTWKYIGLFLIGLVGVIIASRFVVDSATFIAKYFSVPDAIIGLTIVAFGTSLPEISTAVISARKGHGDLAAGDIIGANVLNLLWIIGVSAMIKPINLGINTVIVSFSAVAIVVGSMYAMMRYKYNLTRWNGIVLFILYVIYLIVTYFVPSLSA